MKLRLQIAVVWLVFLGRVSCEAFLAYHPSLEDRFESSALIVVGVPCQVPSAMRGPKEWTTFEARVTIQEVLKGKYAEKEMLIPVHVGGSDQPRFELGQVQIIFLEPMNQGNILYLEGSREPWIVNFGARGVVTVNAEALAAYRKSLASWTELRMKGKPSEAERMGWLVEQCKEAHVRDQAAEGLTRIEVSGDRFKLKTAWRPDQLLAISNAVFTTKKLGLGDFKLLYWIPVGDRGVQVRFLLDHLEKMKNESQAQIEHLHWTHSLVTWTAIEWLRGALEAERLKKISEDFRKFANPRAHLEAFLEVALKVASEKGYVAKEPGSEK